MKQYDSKVYLVKILKTKDYIQIAKENNVSTKTIQRKLKKFGLTNPSEKWSEEELTLLKKEYELNPDVYSLFPDRTTLSINHKASRLSLPKKIPVSGYRVNSHFFKSWSDEMAYVLGWFFSDGCVHSNNRCCSIHLHKKDTEILEKLKKVMQSTHPLYFIYDSVALRIYDYLLHKTLIKLGCIPRKSLVVNFPDVPIEYLNHFIRGYFDGDGSICFNKPNVIKVRIFGSKLFIEKLQAILEDLLSINFNQTHTIGNLYSCECYGDNARKLCRWMYKDSEDLYLQRKWNRFDNHLKLRDEVF